jgi:ABC-type lipoprotein export system ATPase subunit
VLVTHDAELAAIADARLTLRDGRVVENSLRPLDQLGVDHRKPVKEPAAR